MVCGVGGSFGGVPAKARLLTFAFDTSLFFSQFCLPTVEGKPIAAPENVKHSNAAQH